MKFWIVSLLFFCYSLVYFLIFCAYSRNCVTWFYLWFSRFSPNITSMALKNFQNYLISDIRSRKEYFWRGRIRRLSVYNFQHWVFSIMWVRLAHFLNIWHISISAIDHIVQVNISNNELLLRYHNKYCHQRKNITEKNSLAGKAVSGENGRTHLNQQSQRKLL